MLCFIPMEIPKITFWQHIRHPFTIAATTTLSTKERITAAALFCLGTLLALIGGPLLFYSYTYSLKAKRIRMLNSHDSAPLQAIQFNALQILKPKVFVPQPDQSIKAGPTPLPKPVIKPSSPQPTQVDLPKADSILKLPAQAPILVPQRAPVFPCPIDFGALKLLPLQKAQGQTLENLYKTSQETLQSYAKGTPVSYQELAKIKKAIDALEIALNELTVHWLQTKEADPDPKNRDQAQKALESESGLSSQLRRFIASSKRDIIRFTQIPINTKDLAHEVEQMKKLPRELQDYRLESILASQYRVCKIQSDGNCGPRALAQGLGRGDEHTIRKEVTDYQLKNLDNPEQPWRYYYSGSAENSISDMQKSGRYFTDMELSAFSEIHKRPVNVLSIQSIEVKNNRLRPANGYAWGEQYKGTPIWLYHRPQHDNSGQQNSLELNHYDLLQSSPHAEMKPGILPQAAVSA